MTITQSDIDELLQKMAESKDQKETATKKYNKYKTYAKKIMTDKQTTILESDEYKLVKRLNKTTNISRDKVPDNIWKDYSQTISFEAFYLSSK